MRRRSVSEEALLLYSLAISESLFNSLVAQCAAKIKADYIVTRKVKDFKASPVEAITPEELFARLREQGFDYEEVDW